MSGLDNIGSLTTGEKLYIRDALADVENLIDETASLSNPYVPRGEAIDTIDAPTGLRLIDNVGVIHVAWNHAFTRYVLYYEVQFASDGGFTQNVKTFQERELEYTFYAATGTARYVRVRTVTPSGPSGWTPTLDSQTGFAATGDLAPGAITGWSEIRRSSFTPADAMLDDGTWAPYGTDLENSYMPWPNAAYQGSDYDGDLHRVSAMRTWCSMTVSTNGGIVRPRWSVSALAQNGNFVGLGGYGFAVVRVAIMRDGVPVGRTFASMFYIEEFSQTLYPFYFTGHVFNDEPGVGEFTYELLAGVDMADTDTWSGTPGDIRMEIYPVETSLNITELRR